MCSDNVSFTVEVVGAMDVEDGVVIVTFNIDVDGVTEMLAVAIISDIVDNIPLVVIMTNDDEAKVDVLVLCDVSTDVDIDDDK